jgi:hypothetical protein
MINLSGQPDKATVFTNEPGKIDNEPIAAKTTPNFFRLVELFLTAIFAAHGT